MVFEELPFLFEGNSLLLFEGKSRKYWCPAIKGSQGI